MNLYLLIILALPVFLFFSLRAYKQMKNWLAAFDGTKIKRIKNLGRIFMLSSVLLLATISLIGLSIEYEVMEAKRKGILIALGLDTSRSMLAEDVMIPDKTYIIEGEYANRLNRGRLEGLRLINQLKGERLGVFFFAFRGVKAVDDFTDDYGACKYILVNYSLDLAFTGSNIDHALRTGASMFGEDSKHKHKVIVFISDGELEDDAQIESVLAEARNLRENGITVYTIGIGKKEDTSIPKRGHGGQKDWFTDKEGKLLKTKMNEEVLKEIASVTRGKYYYAAADKLVIDEVIKDILKGAKDIKTIQEPVKKEVNLAAIFLLAAVLLWLVWEFLIVVRVVK